MSWGSDDIVLACLGKYKAALGIEYRVTRWPDREESGSPEIDTYAEAPNAMPLAFEVTKIESFADQRFDDRRIAELADVLESELGSVFPQGAFVLVQSGVIKPGFDWKQGHARIKNYLMKVATTLQPGTSSHVIPDVPFPVFISYEPDLRTRFAVGRNNPYRLDQWYCFLGPDEILDRVNLPNLRLGPRFDTYWETGIREGRV